jgi:hypothetical protein
MYGIASLRAAALSLACVALGAAPAPELPRTDLMRQALAHYRELEAAGRVKNRVLTIVDYGLPSSQRRLWVIDPDSGRVRYHEFVAHGRGSADPRDPDRAVRFGNEVASRRSSLGAFLTGASYLGQHGYSLELSGLEPGVNDRALERRIVIHPADYVTAEFLEAHGRLGRSFGCPALDPKISRARIDLIRDGSVLYVGAAAK